MSRPRFLATTFNRVRFLLGLTAMLAALTLSTGVASASIVHFPEASFGPDGTTGTTFLEPEALAVDQSTGDVYVLVRGAAIVQRFKANGEPKKFSALGTNTIDGAGDGKCATVPADCDQTPRGFFQFFEVSGLAQVAVDSSSGPAAGYIYVTNSFPGTVDVFKPTGEYAGQIDGSAASPQQGGETTGVSVDSSGNVYISYISGHVDKYTPIDGTPENNKFEGQLQNLSLPANLAVDSTGAISVVSWPSGPLTRYPASQLNEASPVGETIDPTASTVYVDPETDDIYSDEIDRLAQFDSTGTLLGRSGDVELTQSYGVAVNGATNQVYAADNTTGLIYRFGAGVEVEPPLVTIDPIASPSAPTPHVTGTVDPEGRPTTCAFEYVTDAQFTSEGFSGAGSIPCANDPGSGTSPVTVEADLRGLKGSTAYHVRLAATNPAGTTFSAEPNPSFETEVVNPPTVEIKPPSNLTGTGAHFSAEVSPNAPGPAPQDPAYDTKWSFQCEPGCPGLKGGTVPGDDATHLVGEDATGLQPNTHYVITVVVENAGGKDEDTTSFDSPAIAPGLVTNYNTPEPEGKVRLVAYVNPFNSEVTECHFEYGLDQSYGQQAPCEGTPGAGGEPVEVNAKLSGLTPGATYHYRVVASSGGGAGQSPDATFVVAEEPASSCPNPHALGANTLGECRAWEMVSPPDKNGGNIFSNPERTRMAADGSAAAFASLTPFGDTSGTGVASDYMSVRSPSGWATHGTSPSQPPTSEAAVLKGLEPRYDSEFTRNLGAGVFLALHPLDDSDPNVAAVMNLYLRDDLHSPGAGNYRLITGCPLCAEPGGEALPASAILERPRFIAANADYDHILFESKFNLVAPAQDPGTKLYEWDDGTLRLAGILPSGDAATESRSAATSAHFSEYARHSISADGSKVFFTAAGNLYMRMDGQETIQLNLPDEGAPAGAPQSAEFSDASVDGSRVFFTSNQALTADGSGGLYMYDTTKPAGDPHKLTLVSPSAEEVLGASADGGIVYFWATSRLMAGAPPLTGRGGLYVWRDGEIRFIAPLEPQDTLAIAARAKNKSSRISPEGQVLFSTSLPVGPTGEAHGSCPGKVTRACHQYYTYDPDTEALQCVSCGSVGPQANSSAEISIVDGTGGSSIEFHFNRAISDEGSHAFFSSPVALVPDDTNGVMDAYVFDARTARVSLISSGSDAAPSIFQDASADGSDAVFITGERLSGWDVDTNNDLYDARIGGGLPEPSPPPPACQGDACQPPPVTLNDPTPASSSYRGAGNQVRKHKNKRGRKKARAHRHKNKRSRRKARAQHHKHQHRRATDNKRRAGR